MNRIRLSTTISARIATECAALWWLVACATETAESYRYVDITGRSRGEAELKAASDECQALRARLFNEEVTRIARGAGPGSVGSSSQRANAPQLAAEYADREMEKCYLNHGWEKRPAR